MFLYAKPAKTRKRHAPPSPVDAERIRWPAIKFLTRRFGMTPATAAQVAAACGFHLGERGQ